MRHEKTRGLLACALAALGALAVVCAGAAEIRAAVSRRTGGSSPRCRRRRGSTAPPGCGFNADPATWAAARSRASSGSTNPTATSWAAYAEGAQAASTGRSGTAWVQTATTSRHGIDLADLGIDLGTLAPST
jgi:hypothetical protein